MHLAFYPLYFIALVFSASVGAISPARALPRFIFLRYVTLGRKGPRPTFRARDFAIYPLPRRGQPFARPGTRIFRRFPRIIGPNRTTALPSIRSRAFIRGRAVQGSAKLKSPVGCGSRYPPPNPYPSVPATHHSAEPSRSRGPERIIPTNGPITHRA
jgi:hypothetical protein